MTGPTVAGHTYDGVQLVTHEDRNAGFCALLTYALNGVRRALELNRLPVVLFDAESSPQFFTPEEGPNVWEYYFEPVAGISYAELVSRSTREPWLVHRFTFQEILHHHLRDPDRIATFWAYEEPPDPAAWMAEKRALGRRFVARYIRVKPELRARALAFHRERLAGRYTIGVHLRGTDFAYAETAGPERYVEGIRAHAERLGLAAYNVYLATDQEQFVDYFRSELGDRLVVSDCLRSRGAVAPFNLDVERPRHLLGVEVLLDILLLARSDHLFKGASAVGEYALWFAPDLECTDFGLSSRFRTRQLDLLVPAFTRLNVAGRRGVALRLARWLSNLEWPRRLVLVASRSKGWIMSRLRRLLPAR